MKRFFALFLSVLLIVGLLAACGGGKEENPNKAPENTTAPSYTGPVDDEGVNYEIELPLVEDTYTFSYWMPGASFEDFASYDDNLFFQWMEKQTNIHINFMHPTTGGEAESFQTMVLSNDYPDFVQNVKGYYSGGMDKAIQDNFLVRLNEYVDEYMPNYRAIVYRDEETFIQSITDTGNLWGIHRIADRPQTAADGLGVRGDWLDRAGLTTDDCETIAQLGDVLRAFKEFTYENAGPLWLARGGINGQFDLNGAYGIVNPTFNSAGFINKNGVATYTPIEQGMKDYVGQIADWYAEGLVNKNFIADAGWAVPEDRWGNSEVGVGQFCYVFDKTFASAAANSALMPDPNFKLVAVTSPKLNKSDDWTDIHLGAINAVVTTSNSCGITTHCDNMELACKWWDYQWTAEGRQACNWGPYVGEKGDTNATYYIDETDANQDGHKEVYQPWLMEKYPSVYQLQVKVARHVAPNYTIWSREWSTLEPYQIEYCRIWERVGTDWNWPEGVSLTADEGNEASTILTNCNTAFNEWAAKVMTGEKPVDTFDTELVPMIKGMNIDRAVEIYQTALGRYIDRAQFLN